MMKLSVEYLSQRHEYWKKEIGEAGIWDESKFQPVTFEIRKKNRSYNALFYRCYKKKGDKRILTDKIIFYNNTDEFEPDFVDNVMVHEMIHQYLYQNKLNGKTPHGPLFRDYMTRVNQKMQGRLQIKIKDLNPSKILEGEGELLHLLLIINQGDFYYVCVINPSKIKDFNKKIKSMQKRGMIKDFEWAFSRNVYYERFRRCTRSLHGEKIISSKIQDYISCHHINKLDTLEQVDKQFSV